MYLQKPYQGRVNTGMTLANYVDYQTATKRVITHILLLCCYCKKYARQTNQSLTGKITIVQLITRQQITYIHTSGMRKENLPSKKNFIAFLWWRRVYFAWWFQEPTCMILACYLKCRNFEKDTISFLCKLESDINRIHFSFSYQNQIHFFNFFGMREREQERKYTVACAKKKTWNVSIIVQDNPKTITNTPALHSGDTKMSATIIFNCLWSTHKSLQWIQEC